MFCRIIKDSMENVYYVKIEQFEGPFSLLLELIEKNKLDVTRVSLAKVADDYLSYIESSHVVELANLSEFLLIASQLILLKSKALLPLFEFTQEEDEEIDNLEERLKEYQQFKQASVRLQDLLAASKCFFSKDEEVVALAAFQAPDIRTGELFRLFKNILQQIPQSQELQQEIVTDVITLEDKMHHLRRTLEKRMNFAFHETIKEAKNKVEVIVTFLAMLEMVKQKIIAVSQEQLFGDIMISKKNYSVNSEKK